MTQEVTVAKSTQYQEKLGSLADFKAPWESEAGGDAEVDKSKLKNLIYNLKADLAKARDAGEDLKATLSEVETERDEAKKQAADGSGAEAQKQIDKLTKERDDAVKERDSLQGEKDQAALRKEVLGDFEAANPKAAKYVTGTTKEELEASLEEVKADWGISEEDPEETEEEESNPLRSRPRTGLLNAGDKESGKPGDKPFDADAVADSILSGRSIFS